MSKIGLGEISQLVIAHKDRLARFGFDYFNHYGCQIVVANQQSLSPEQEMVENLLTIVHCFSSQLYRLRLAVIVLNQDSGCCEEALNSDITSDRSLSELPNLG